MYWLPCSYYSGRYAVPKRIIAYDNARVDTKFNVAADYPVITDGELEQLEDDYVEAAIMAWRAGFRAVDIKVTHGYLLSELLVPAGRALRRVAGESHAIHQKCFWQNSRLARQTDDDRHAARRATKAFLMSATRKRVKACQSPMRRLIITASSNT